MISAIFCSDDAQLEELAQAAAEHAMHLISNGRKVVVSPIVPPGFIKIAVKFKPAPIPPAY